MNIRVDHAQYQPTERPIEDRVFILRDDTRVVVGVFDGHGGSSTAEYLKEHLPRSVLSDISAFTLPREISEQLTTVFQNVDREMISAFTEDFKQLLRIPSRTLRRLLIGKKLADEEVLARAYRVKSGSTALVVYLEGENLILANTGDCRAVMGQVEENIGPYQLTTDLNAENAEERIRMQREHPGEEHVITGTRVLGQIGVTRSFGDAFYKLNDVSYTDEVFGHPLMTPKSKLSMRETHSPYYTLIQSAPYLTAAPEVTSVTLRKEDVFLVIASDGLWNVEGISNNWVVETVMQGLVGKRDNLAEYLMERAREVGSPGDDVTIAVVNFKVL